MLVHCRSLPRNLSAFPTIQRYPFILLGGERHCKRSVCCQIEPRQLDPAMSALNMRPPPLHQVMNRLQQKSQILVINRIRIFGSGQHTPHPTFLRVSPPPLKSYALLVFVKLINDVFPILFTLNERLPFLSKYCPFGNVSPTFF